MEISRGAIDLGYMFAYSTLFKNMTDQSSHGKTNMFFLLLFFFINSLIKAKKIGIQRIST